MTILNACVRFAQSRLEFPRIVRCARDMTRTVAAASFARTMYQSSSFAAKEKRVGKQRFTNVASKKSS